MDNGSIGGQARAWFWSAEYWLPRGVSWEDLHPDNGLNYPNDKDIWTYPIIFAFFLILFRSWILNSLILEPLAKKLGLKARKVKPPPPNYTLEMIFQTNNGCVPSKAIEEASASLQLTRREVERWLRSRAAITKLSKLDKFQDSAFIFLYHIFITVFGLAVMLTKPWLYDISLCYRNFPYHEIDNGIWWYYMLGCALYWSLTIWQYKFSHGKDAKIAYIHHLCTILLMACSWTCNYIRIGTLVLLVHECGDIPLQLAKILRYLKEKVILDYVYGSFVVLWFVTRLVLFPFWILRSILVEMPKHADLPRVTVFHGFLFVLLLLNVVWSIWIAYSLYKRLVHGFVENVVSSDDSLGESNSEMKEE